MYGRTYRRMDVHLRPILLESTLKEYSIVFFETQCRLVVSIISVNTQQLHRMYRMLGYHNASLTHCGSPAFCSDFLKKYIFILTQRQYKNVLLRVARIRKLFLVSL